MEETKVIDALKRIMDKYFALEITDKEAIHEIVKLYEQIKKAPNKRVQNQ